MEIPSSQPGQEQTQGDKRRAQDGTSVRIEQWNAASIASQHTIRSFRYEELEIKNTCGQSVWVKMWVSDEKPRGVAQKEVEVFKCETCGKEFDKRQKVLLHARFHNK